MASLSASTVMCRLQEGRNYFDRVVAMMGAPDVLLEERWYAPEAQYDPELEDEFNAYFISWCLERAKQEIWQLAQESRVLSAPINTDIRPCGRCTVSAEGSFRRVRPSCRGHAVISRKTICNERVALEHSTTRAAVRAAHG